MRLYIRIPSETNWELHSAGEDLTRRPGTALALQYLTDEEFALDVAFAMRRKGFITRLERNNGILIEERTP